MNQKEYIGKKIRHYREDKLGISADKLGEMLNPIKSGKTVLSWERGRTEPDGNILIQLCVLFGVDISDFYYKPSEYQYAVVSTDTSQSAWVEIPYYGAIAAGTPIEMLNVDDTYLVPSKIINEHPGHRLGVLKIKGNSYNAGGIFDGFFVVVDFDETEPKNEHTPYAVSIDDETATVKAIEKLEDGLRLLPNSYDPTIKPITFDYNKDDGRNVSVLGEVIWTFAPFDYRF